MKAFLFAFGLLLLNPILGHAQPALIVPASDYPAHSHLTATLAVSNQDYDCHWGLDCQSGTALFHSDRSDRFHRTSGWLQAGGYHRGRTEMAWMLTASTCEAADSSQSGPWSEQLALDFNARLQANGFVPSSLRPTISVAGVDPQPTISAWRQPVIEGWTAYGLSAWIGTTDYEAVGIAKGTRDFKRMRHSLIAQFRDALLVPRAGT